MSEPRKSTLPWEKQLVDLNKYDWIIAVGYCPMHKNHPRDLRVANALMQKADLATNLMWATQQTIAQYADLADVRQVRSSVKRLAASGALDKRRIADLQPDILESLNGKMDKNRNRRGTVYRLKMFWAFEIFEGHAKRCKEEPLHLRKSRDNNRTGVVLNNRTGVVLSEQDWRSPAYTTSQNYNDTERGFERKEDLESTREGNSYSHAKGRR